MTSENQVRHVAEDIDQNTTSHTSVGRKDKKSLTTITRITGERNVIVGYSGKASIYINQYNLHHH
jgi:hypothetical protein